MVAETAILFIFPVRNSKAMKRNRPNCGIAFLAIVSLLCFFPFSAHTCDTSGFIINDLTDNGNGTFTLEMTILVAGGNSTIIGSTYGFYWNINVPILSISPTSLTSSNGTTLDAVISGNNITWGDPDPSTATPFLDINASNLDESFQVTIILDGPPTEWNGGGQESNICPNGGGAILSNYMGEFPCQPGQIGASDLTLETCDGGFVFYEGFVLNEGTTTNVTLTGSNGCDSIVTVTVNGTGPLTGSEMLLACGGQPVIYNGVELPPGGSMDFLLTSQGGCDSIVTVSVSDNLPNAEAADTFELCIGNILEVAGLTITEPGIYPQTFTAANGCDSVYTVFVELADGPLLEMPASVEIELGDDWVLKPLFSPLGQLTFEWELDPTLSCPDGGNDCPNPTVMPIGATTYFLTITDDEGCISQGTVEILVINRQRVYIPNTFSPNGDGINDSFVVFTDEDATAQINHFQIYSRWGELVFENYNLPANDIASGWDGTFRGEEMDNGIFVFKAEVEFIDGEILNLQGDVLLVK